MIRGKEAKTLFGCDFVVKLSTNRRKVRLLQITDTQIIDAQQRRTPDRLRQDEIIAWSSDKFNENFGNHLKSLITQANPDLIFITGDMVYGSFDDSGKTFSWLCNFMDSFCVPWASVFGNHDNESQKGVEWQCSMLENTKYGLFKKGSVSGNGNYTVGICVGIVRLCHVGASYILLAPIFVCKNQSVAICRCSSFFAKGHIRVGYSVASALITPLAHYQPFARGLRREYFYVSEKMKKQKAQYNGISALFLALCQQLG